MVLGFKICCLGFRVQLRLKRFSEDWLDLGSLLVVGSFRIGIWIRGSQTTVKVSIFFGGRIVHATALIFRHCAGQPFW